MQSTGFVNGSNLNDAKSWSLGLLQMDFFYRKRKWYAGQFVRKIDCKFKIDENMAHFFTTILNHQKSKLLSVLVRDVDKTFNESIVKLPIDNNGINLSFIGDFMSEIRRLGLLQVKKYLADKKLDIDLTSDESKALKDFKVSNIDWAKFKLNKLFNIDSWDYGKNKLYLNISTNYKSGYIPVISGITEKNGINYYTNDDLQDNEIYERELTISTRGEYSGKVFFQSRKFALANNILVMKMPNLSNNAKLFFATVIDLLPYGGYGGYPRKETLKKDLIWLPLKDNQIDFKFINDFVNAILKTISKEILRFI